MLLYSPQLTPRLTYILRMVGSELFNKAIEVTTDLALYTSFQGLRINYSQHRTDRDTFFIQSTNLLFETGIQEQPIDIFSQNGYKAFFRTQDDMGFDVLAASFYLLSRYEEYLPYQKDEYGRYAHTNSLAFKEGFLHLPLVNSWLQDLRKKILSVYPDAHFHRSEFKFLATYDIDIAYSYRYKGWLRNIGGATKSLLKGQWKLVMERMNVLRGKTRDPYDAYEWLDALHLYCRPRAFYFFLVADKVGEYDKNIHPTKAAMQQLIRYTASGCGIGLHPSWQSGDNEKLLNEELTVLESIARKDIVTSRQHYIRFTVPETYRKLINVGIRNDYSMGYGTINGFRASIASPFNWYDLEQEQITDLIVYPFCFMDANSYYELKQTPQQAFNEMMHYYHAIKSVNGLMITVWHNNFLGTDSNFKGWREVYEIFLRDHIYWDR